MDKLSYSVSYGLLSVPFTLMSLTFYLFLPKWYLEFPNTSVALIGGYFLLARIWDAVTDPLVGMLSDTLTNRGYRRSVLIIWGVLLSSLSFYLLLYPEIFAVENFNFHFVVFSMLFFLGMTLVAVPYESLGIEISDIPKIRTKFIAFREGFLILGTVLTSLVPYYFISTDGRIDSEDRLTIGASYSTFLFLCCLLVARTESKISNARKVLYDSARLQSFAVVLKDKNFLILLFSFTTSSLGAALPAALFLFFNKFYLYRSDEEGTLSLALYFLVGFIFMPLWVRLLNKYNKKNVWFLAQIINAGAFLPVYFLGEDSGLIFNLFIATSAIGFGGALIAPSIIQAEFVSAKSAKVNIPIKGMAVGIWSICRKFAQGVGAGAGLYLLSLYSFDPRMLEITADSKQVLGLLYSVVPSVLCFLSILVATNFKLENKDV